MTTSFLIKPTWQAPNNIYAGTTARQFGNMALHVDQSEGVEKNRTKLMAACKLPSKPIWLNQTHSTNVINAGLPDFGRSADAAYTNQAGIVCAVMTADCLPILMCNRDGTEIAAIHAGWKGLCNGIIACLSEKRT